MNREERRLKRQQDTRRATVIFAVFAVVVIAAVAGAAFGISRFVGSKAKEKPQTEAVNPGTEAPATEEVQPEPEPAPAEDPFLEQAKAAVAGMTLEDKLAQMFIITPDALTGYGGVTAAGDTTKEWYDKRPVGGMIYASNNLTDTEQTKAMLANMQGFAKERTGLPIFLSVIEEGGSVTRIAGNAGFSVTDVGTMQSVGETGDTQNAYNAGTVIGTYLAELGFNLNYAPVADLRAEGDAMSLGDRAFGTDANAVADMVSAELQGMESMGVYGAVKFFPGVGLDAGGGSAVSNRTAEELLAQELVPFKRAVEEGVSFIMVGHAALPQVTGDNVPASLSAAVVTDLLRGQLGYDGIVVTDAMSAGAVTGAYNSDTAAVMAVTAGADMILLPADYETAYNGLLTAVNNGTITEERINESVTRIVRVKLAMNR